MLQALSVINDFEEKENSHSFLFLALATPFAGSEGYIAESGVRQDGVW
jgi:hypothetical protein